MEPKMHKKFFLIFIVPFLVTLITSLLIFNYQKAFTLNSRTITALENSLSLLYEFNSGYIYASTLMESHADRLETLKHIMGPRKKYYSPIQIINA